MNSECSFDEVGSRIADNSQQLTDNFKVIAKFDELNAMT
jgi:hypothetical protein